AERTEIQMSPMSEQQINDYVDSGEADGKAGAYAIQETGDRYAHLISGSFSNVVGLPLERLSIILRELEA
ncbi:MAG: Maf family protein, partial [Planctomycetes bacterium]|nr:Maf family protein [Planctomycetota bacterium]